MREPTPARTGTAAPSPPGTPAVQLRGVTVRVPGRGTPLLTGVDLDIDAGEEVLVLGASGSGKSSLLAVITGAIPHAVTAELVGEVRLAGRDVTGDPVVERSRLVTALPQDPAAGVCLPTVEQDLAMVCENRAVPAHLIDGTIDDALAAVGARQLRGRPAGSLSGGELQRTAVAVAAVVAPTVLVLDEPTALLDPRAVADVRGAVAAVRRRWSPAVVVVEHRLDDWAGAAGVAALPGRTVVVQDGRIAFDGPTGQILTDHAAALHAAGCWLPLDAELRAVFGAPPARLVDAVTAAPRPLPPATGRQRAPGTPVLTARGLAVGRPGRPVLTDVDLTLDGGEIVAVVGANGAGKSTLLLTLAGLLRPLAGEVTADRPGMVFQNPEHGFVGRTVEADIGSGLASAGATVDEQLSNHRLRHCPGQSPFRLSGGEKRRLSLAAMLAHRRNVLLADEPTHGLDRRDARDAGRALRVAAAAGAAVVFSAHDLRLVATHARRLVVLADERVHADGPVLAVLRDPEVRAAAALALPVLLQRLFAETDDDEAVHRVLTALDAPPAAGVG